MVRYFLFLLVFNFNLNAFAIDFDSKNELYLAGNSYAGDFEFSEKNQILTYWLSENKIIFNKSFDLSVSPELFYLDNLKTKDEDRALIEPKEFSLNYYGSKVSLKLGFFQMKKEGPDVFDPFDYQQPKNYLDPLHTGNLSLLGLKTELEVNNYLSFEIAYIPKNRVPVVPTKSSPWLPRENKFPTQSDQFLATLPEQVSYKITDNKASSENDLNNNYIFKTKIITSNADIILQIAETLSSTPEISPTLTGTLIATQPVFQIALDNPVELNIHWHKVKNYGAGIVAPIENLKMLTKLFINQQVSAQENTLMTTLAFEKYFQSITLVFEATKQNINHNSNNSNASTFANLYENAMALGVRYAPIDQLSLLLGGLYDNNLGSYLMTLKPKYYFTQHFYTELQLIALGGRKDSLLWYFDKNDSVSLKLGATF